MSVLDKRKCLFNACNNNTSGFFYYYFHKKTITDKRKFLLFSGIIQGFSLAEKNILTEYEVERIAKVK